VAVPAATPVNFAVHMPDESVQLAATVPAAVFEDVKVTVPVGMLEGVVVSVTVAVHVEAPVGMIVAGVHTITVDVVSNVTTGTPAVARALGSVTPLTDAPTRRVSGSTAAPAVINTQSFVPVTLPPEHPELTRTSMPVCVVESTLYVTVNNSPVVGCIVTAPRESMPRLATPLPSMPA
jgi:hypothetical protein